MEQPALELVLCMLVASSTFGSSIKSRLQVPPPSLLDNVLQRTSRFHKLYMATEN